MADKASTTAKAKAPAKPRLSTVERLRAELEKAEAKAAERRAKADRAKRERLTGLIERRTRLTQQIEELESELTPAPVEAEPATAAPEEG